MLNTNRITPLNPRQAGEGVKTVWTLIFINVIVFVLVGDKSDLYRDLALNSWSLRNGAYYELFTAMFLHGGIGHIFFNMWGLYIFGMLVAPILGMKRFLMLYFISGVTGNLLWVLCNWSSPFFVVGASGALFGVMLAVAMIMPNVRFMLLFPPIPLKASTLVIVYAAIEILSQLGNSGSQIAHLAHLGGFVGAYFYLWAIFGSQLPWSPFRLFSGGDRRSGGGPKLWKSNEYRNLEGGSGRESSAVSPRELEALLDKISQHGINSLSEEEMRRLRLAREQMKNNR